MRWQQEPKAYFSRQRIIKNRPSWDLALQISLPPKSQPNNDAIRFYSGQTLCHPYKASFIPLCPFLFVHAPTKMRRARDNGTEQMGEAGTHSPFSWLQAICTRRSSCHTHVSFVTFALYLYIERAQSLAQSAQNGHKCQKVLHFHRYCNSRSEPDAVRRHPSPRNGNNPRRVPLFPSPSI